MASSDFHLSTLRDKYGNSLNSDEEYAEELQLQEALVSQINASISSSSSQTSLKNMASSDFHLSTLCDKYGNSLNSDEEYAEELQLQEALVSQINASISSSSSQTGSSSISSSSSQQDASSTSLSSTQNDPSSTLPPSCQIDVSSSTSSSQKDASSSSSSSSIPATYTPMHALKIEQPMVTSEESQSSKSFCDICMDTKSPSEMFSNATVCGHLYCSDCISGLVSEKIKENIVSVKCPDPKCKEVIGPEHCRAIVPKEVLERWEDALCESLILGTEKFYCPFKDCSAMMVDDGGEAVASAECPNCHRLFCAQCKVTWHSGMDCNEFQSLKKDERTPEDILLTELAQSKKWRRCPSCRFIVEKRDGCHHISCRCGFEFCYACGEKYDINHACNA